MKKFLLALVVLGGTAFSSFAQSDSDGGFSIGFDAGLPVGNAKNIYSSILGGSIKYDVPVADQLFVTGSAGYSSLKAKGNLGSTGVVPIKVGLKYFFNQGFFGEGQVGAVISTSKGGGTQFAYAPGVGYAFDGGLELGVRYEAWTNKGTTGQAALRLAYNF